MRRIPFIALAGALAVSLWFNWRNQASRLEATLGSFDPAANPAPLMPLKLEEIDFSGTGLSDEAWELPSPKTEEIIPSTLSEPPHELV